ncbi:MAG TPA: SAM-dependent methyltransferase [Acidimicrobiia bacterium]
MSLAHRLRQHIVTSGPLPFEQFMAACLYDAEGGFFTAGPLRSEEAGDFLTSPEVSRWFGRIIARHVAAERERLGWPEGFAVAEVGAGSGSLLEGLRAALGDDAPDLWAADVSPAARERLAAIVGSDRVVAGLEELPDEIVGVVIANELIDNLPASLAVRTSSGWEERWVGQGEAGDLALVAAPARPEVAAWADAYAPGTPNGGLVEVQLAAARWLTAALERLAAGTLLVVDYGGTAEELAPRRTRGTLRTYRAHHLGPDPLLAPGATDVTVDVNFTAMAAVAEAAVAGAAAGAGVELLRQDDYLARWGLRDVVAELRRRELELAKGDQAMARLAVRAERTDAETLLHPRGLGDFRVLVATVG